MMASARFTSAMADQDRNILQSEEIFDLRILDEECRAWRLLCERSMRAGYTIPGDICLAVEDLISLRAPASCVSLEDREIFAVAELDILRRLIQACASWDDARSRRHRAGDYGEPHRALHQALKRARRWLP